MTKKQTESKETGVTDTTADTKSSKVTEKKRKKYPKPTIKQIREIIGKTDIQRIDNTYLLKNYGYSIGMCNKIINYLSNTKYRDMQENDIVGFPVIIRNYQTMIDYVMYEKGKIKVIEE